VLFVDGERLELQPQEVLVQTHPAAGLAVAADRQATVAVDTNVTPELRAEGLAREIVRRVQALRKEAGFNIEDRILTYYQAEGVFAQVMESWSGYIRSETLSTGLVNAAPPSGAYAETYKVDGMQITLGVQRAPVSPA
jgi:isoleucyl-tRNA synthetase